MRTTLLAVLALVAAAGASPATADPGHRYEGGCGLLAVADPTAWNALGTPEGWHGVAYAHGRATDGGSPPLPTNDALDIRCDLFVNGAHPTYGIVSSDGDLTVERVTYVAGPADVVTICAHVQAGSYPPTYHCTDTSTTPVVPAPVAEALDVLAGAAAPALAAVAPTTCATLSARAGRYGPLMIADDGDVFLFGDSAVYRWYDCPPYDWEPSEPVAEPTIASS